MPSFESQIIGCLVGTAIGDAIGLPYEGLSPTRAAKLLGPPDRHRFIFGRGMVSDDTEHTCMIAQSLIDAGQDSEQFQINFARRLQWWFVGLPAGVGKATAIACLKMWIGVGRQKSGVFSAGNGPAMRSAILGVTIDEPSVLYKLVHAHCHLTHTDPKAFQAALVVASAASYGSRNTRVDSQLWFNQLRKLLPGDADEITGLLGQTIASVASEQSTREFAVERGLERGVTGYAFHTVPVAIHAWLSHPDDFRTAIFNTVSCGGDADTTAAIVGGIVGARVGRAGIPQEWVQGMADWPRTISWIENLGTELSNQIQAARPGNSPPPNPAANVPRLNPCASLARNLLFLAQVLVHGFRRLLPPY